PGEIVAIVGASGSGKSTLVRLLLRFHDVGAGAVLVDGHDVRDLTLASLRANMAVAFQDPYVVRGSIMDNVRYGRPGASDAGVARSSSSVIAWPRFARPIASSCWKAAASPRSVRLRPCSNTATGATTCLPASSAGRWRGESSAI